MTYPPIPDVPACWSWETPPLPQPAHLGALIEWQKDRCAICGVHRPSPNARPVLHEDHDHATGDTRGFLCTRCNTGEGHDRHPVFELYRQRSPASILGTLHRYRCGTHPAVAAAERALELALEEVDDRQRGRGEAEHLAALRERIVRAGGVPPRDLYPDPERMVLADALERVGLTQRVWWDVQSLRRDLAGGWTTPDLADEWRYVHRVGGCANVMEA